MPPSYSMMLPGRMSTPEIFMVQRASSTSVRPELVEGRSWSWSEGQGFDQLSPNGLCSLKAALLASDPFSGKQRIGVDRAAVIPLLARLHPVDREVEVWPGRAGVTGMPDATEDLPAPDP